MAPIGPGLNLNIPTNVLLSADRGYPDDSSLLTPVRAGQMYLLNHRERRRSRKFNRALANRRVKIEDASKRLRRSGLWVRSGDIPVGLCRFVSSWQHCWSRDDCVYFADLDELQDQNKNAYVICYNLV